VEEKNNIKIIPRKNDLRFMALLLFPISPATFLFSAFMIAALQKKFNREMNMITILWPERLYAT